MSLAVVFDSLEHIHTPVSFLSAEGNFADWFFLGIVRWI